MNPNPTEAMLDIAGAWVRGGTSKCWIFAAEAVEAAHLDLDVLLENALGSGDRRQVDGVGGATSTTSKVAVVSRSAQPGADVDYLFGQVGIEDRVVEWGSNCGNCATAVGLYAVQEGLVAIEGETTTVRLRNINTGAALQVAVATPGGLAPRAGQALVPGVGSGGVPVELTFHGPFDFAGAFPTGQARELVRAGEVAAEATIVKAGAPAILIDAHSVGMTGTESARDIAGMLPMLTGFRAAGAVLHGLIQPGEPAPNAVPKTGVVGPATDYRASDGTLIRAQDYDVAVRMLSMHAAHPAIGLTSAVAVATAAATPGTVVHSSACSRGNRLRIGTLSGVVEVEWTTSEDGSIEGVSLHRAARRLATAILHVPTAADPRLIKAAAGDSKASTAKLAVPA
ncbi:PrpF domain-containing protein [Sinomonas terrae]|uniref:PrpF, AcnD-accessory n=1 Tax=Sinomonas terrae TaxID=2908838 RepID=A0ABS9TWR0_9MICC|nr:PrpF domain-containing protein [Sinomonas terrae]MCH6468861.1 PrpF, AcnD-accessory [Sinomonas terrae]